MQVGVRVKLRSDRDGFRSAFTGKPYTWHNAMTDILGTTQTVASKSGQFAGRADSFGMTKQITDPTDLQRIWFFPISVIECVLGPAGK